MPALAGSQNGYVRCAADGQYAVGVQGYAGEVPAHHLHVPEGQERDGRCPGRIRKTGRALRQGGVRPGGGGIRSGGGAGDRQGGQQVHEQIRSHPVEGGRQEGQQRLALAQGGIAAGQQQVGEEVLHPGDRALGELALEIGEAGKLAARQQLHRPVQGDAALHRRQQLPETVQGQRGVRIFSLASAGDHRAQVQGGQIAHGGVSLGRAAHDGSQNVRSAGGLVQAQGGQQALRGDRSLGNTVEKPRGEGVRASGGVRASAQEQGFIPGGAPGHPVDLP